MGKLAQINASVLEKTKVDDVVKITVSDPIEVHVDVDDIRLLMKSSRIVAEAATQGVTIENGDNLDKYYAFEIEGTVLLVDNANLAIVTEMKNA